MVQAPFHIDAELEACMPQMSLEDFKVFSADIKSRGLQKPIEVVVEEVDGKLVKTIIDGHHRYKACREAGKKDYEILFTKVSFNLVNNKQEAKEYAVRMNDLRRNLNLYQRVTSRLNAFGSIIVIKKLLI